MIETHPYQEQGEQFQALRQEIGLTQAQVAQCLGVDPSYITAIETGEKLLSDEAVITKASYLFLCPVEVLFEQGNCSRYCAVSLRATPITNESLMQLATVHEIVGTQFLMDRIEQHNIPSIPVPEGEDEFTYFMRLSVNFDVQEFLREHRAKYPPLPACEFTPVSQAILAQEPESQELQLLASQLRHFLAPDPTGYFDIFQATLEKIPTLTLVCANLEPAIKGICYQGATSQVIVINHNITLGEQRVALAHELFHLFFNREPCKTISSIYNQHTATEQAANAFASYLLMPTDALVEFLSQHHAYAPHTDKLKLVLELEQTFQISHQCAVERLEQIIAVSELRDLKISNCAAQYGYAPDLYARFQHDHTTNGYYLNQLAHLLQARYIGAQKAREFLARTQNFSSQTLPEVLQRYSRD